MIQVDLVTGFLGSGKTTFIKKYVKFLLEQGYKVGILENDYGAVNVDMLLLNELRGENCELEMVAGGCDSDCHSRRFKTKLISMAMSGYNRIVIEPSGIFDMDEFFDALRESPLDNWYEIGNVFCIVDSLLEQNLSPEAEFILASQMANCGKVILSRADEATEEHILATKDYINRVLANIRVLGDNDFVVANLQDIDKDILCKLNKAGYVIKDYIKRYDLDNLSFDSLCYLEPGLSLEKLEDLAYKLFDNKSDDYGKIMRVKGFVKDNDQWYELNTTQHGVSVKPIGQGQEVFIIIGEMLNKAKIDAIVNLSKRLSP